MVAAPLPVLVVVVMSSAVEASPAGAAQAQRVVSARAVVTKFQGSTRLTINTAFSFPKAARSPQVKAELYLPTDLTLDLSHGSTCSPLKTTKPAIKRCLVGFTSLGFSTSGQSTDISLLKGAADATGQPTLFGAFPNGRTDAASIVPATAPFSSKITITLPPNAVTKYLFPYIKFLSPSVAQSGDCPAGG